MTAKTMTVLIARARKEAYESQLPADIRDRCYLTKLKSLSKQAEHNQLAEAESTRRAKFEQARQVIRALFHS